MRPRLFIASSSESLETAWEIHTLLDNDAEVTPWPQLFKLSEMTLEALLRALDAFDFAVFLFCPNDVVLIRGKKYGAVRDNVIFELGLFMGRLGKGRVFIVMPKAADIRLPSDLAGITTADFEAERDDKDVAAALVPSCQKIRKAIRAQGRRDKTRDKGDLSERIAVLEREAGVNIMSPSKLWRKAKPGEKSVDIQNLPQAQPEEQAVDLIDGSNTKELPRKKQKSRRPKQS